MRAFTYYCGTHRNHVVTAPAPSDSAGRPSPCCPECHEALFWVANGGTVVPCVCGAAVGVSVPHRTADGRACLDAMRARLAADREKQRAGWVKLIDGAWLSPEETAAQRVLIADAARAEELIPAEELEEHARFMRRAGR